jgi:hypothetical protein
MKKYLTFILFLFLGTGLTLAQGKWEGTWNSTQGTTLYLVQSGGYVYGIFGNQGYIFGRVAQGGNRVAGTYTDEIQGAAGRFEWRMSSTGNSFSGLKTWGEEFKVLDINNSTEWKGSRKSGEDLTKVLKSNSLDLRLVSSPQNRLAGVSKKDKKAFYGKANGNAFGGKLSALDVTGKRTSEGNFSFGLSYAVAANSSATGNSASTTTSTSPPKNTRTNTEPKLRRDYKLKITLNSVKLNKARFGNTQKGGFFASVFFNKPTNIRMIRNNVPESWGTTYGSWKIGKAPDISNIIFQGDSKTPWVVGQEVKTNQELIYEFKQTTQELARNNTSVEIWTSFDYNNYTGAGGDMESDRYIDIKEIIKFLLGETDASDYPNAVHGRKRLPNSTDTFWLETIGGKRYARGYGDLFDGKDQVRLGYSYTIELID